MTTQVQYPFDQALIESFSVQNNEPDWFKNLRLAALEKIDVLPLPNPDRTKIDKWNFTHFQQHAQASSVYTNVDQLPEQVKSLINVEGGVKNLYVQHNQTAGFVSLSDELKQKGVIFTDLLTAVKEHGDLVQKYFMTNAVKVDENRLTAFHTALVNGGAFLYIPQNVQINEPIQTIFVHDNADAPLINHVLIVADKNSAVTYVENYFSLNDELEGIANIITEVIALDNANVKFGAVDTLAKGVTTYVNRRGYAWRDARIEWALGLMNDGNTISDNTTNLHGDGSFADTKTVVVGRGKQIQNFTTRVIHHGKGTEGFILKHGVVKDNATTVFNGIGKIEHGASKSNAEQETRVLMLSDKARGDANPILLIDEDDVMAGHAASVGRVDPTQLYYLMSRGISKAEAERLIIYGFLAPVVNQLPVEGVKKQLTEVIERKVK
ncbi:Fe-S cluster assembly protein SufD [Caldifermentibacillus hisashii]|uniref:Fe-S cluster assembly protein SufD n=1 Tax=Caldifermentibacillus hisashii TaxID=996558 RepID=UPI002E1A2594|nr:Fe-S cluster assembly protein SufD [Caldifermentibacillus hisashii]MDL0419927.1 Fe-S cluster assembly protein SufD [Caldibacillus thermoamylovorans]MED3644078.1 Fe-S cluster assembly protein SufD [Caldifermentibacillus hisashii]